MTISKINYTKSNTTNESDMIEKGSKSFEFDKVAVKRTLRNAVIVYGSVISLFLDQIQAGTLDPKILWGATLAITVDAIRRFLTDYSK